MAYGVLGVELQNDYIKAVLLAGGKLETVRDKDGAAAFYGENLFSDMYELNRTFSEMIKRAQRLTGDGIRRMIISVPLGTSFKEFWSIYAIAGRLKAAEHIRMMYQSCAQLMHLALMESAFMGEEVPILMFLEDGDKSEVIAADYSQNVLEILKQELVGEVGNLDDYLDTMYIRPSRVLFTGKRNTEFENRICDWGKKHGLSRFDYAETNIASGAAVYGGSLENLGWRDFLLLDQCGVDVGVELKNGSFIQLVGHDSTIPLKKVRSIPSGDVKTEGLLVKIGTAYRGYTEILIPYKELGAGEVKEIEITMTYNHELLLYVLEKNERIREYNLSREARFVREAEKSAGRRKNEDTILDALTPLQEETADQSSGIMKVILAVDDLRRSIAYAEKAGDSKMSRGLGMIQKQLAEALADFGVKPIPAVGEPFSTELHHAVAHFEDPNLPENTITGEYLTGYKKDDKVLRYSQVVVVN